MSMQMILVLCVVACVAGCKSEPCCHGDPAGAKSERTMSETKPKRIPGLEEGWELAPRASYSAVQRADEVTIKARGEHPASNYEAKLVMSPLRIWPPQWMLARHKTADMGAAVMTKYEATATFKAADPVSKVRITDAEGTQDIAVDQARD